MDIEKLINEIFLRTPIWDQTNSQHHNRDVISKLWQEIANSCGVTTDVAKTKWKNLRDNFRAEWKKIGKGKSGDAGSSPSHNESKWVWFKRLLFLKDQMASRKMSSNLTTPTAGPSSSQIEDSQVEANNDNLDDVENETEENTDTEDQSLLTAARQNTPSVPKSTNYNKRKRNATDTELINIEKKKIQLIESHLVQSKNTEKPKPEDDLYHFLMSLHKPLSDLPIDRQMFVRIKMQELLYNEIIYSKDYQQNLLNSLNGRNSTAENNMLTPNQNNIQYVDPPSVSPMYSTASSSNDDLCYRRLN